MGVKRIAKKKPVKKKLKKVSLDLKLPSEPLEPSDNLLDYTWLIYGERKIGKTTLLKEFGNVLFLMFDPPQKGLKIRQAHCPDWKTFLHYLDELEKNPNYCDLVVIDTGFMCYERCFDYVCKKHGVDDPRDKGWAVVWKDIAREFYDAHDRIMRNYGLAITAHADIKEVTRRDGSSYNKLTTQLSGTALKYYIGLCDFIGYYQYNNKGKRELIVKGDQLIEAGHRFENRFKHIDGSPVESIPVEGSSAKAFKNLQAAFNNELPPVQSKIKALKKSSKKKIKKKIR